MWKIIFILLIPSLSWAGSLVDQKNQIFKWDGLPAKPILVNLSFASCRASCPVLNSRVREIAEPFKGKISIVTVSVDPENDTPAVLNKYTKDRGYDWPNWYFVTGVNKDVFGFIQKQIGWSEIKTPFSHSNSIVLFSASRQKLFEAAAFSGEEVSALKAKIIANL